MLNDPAKCCVIAQVQRIQLPGSKSYVLSGALCSLIYIMLRRQFTSWQGAALYNYAIYMQTVIYGFKNCIK
jgi:hypothetical protein